MQKRFIVVLGVFLLCFIYFASVASADAEVTNPSKSEISKIDIGQVQTSGIETGYDSVFGNWQIDYDELKKYTNEISQILDSCPLPRVIDCDTRCNGLEPGADWRCYYSCKDEQISASDDYIKCIGDAGSSAERGIYIELWGKQRGFKNSCPPTTVDLYRCQQACSDNFGNLVMTYEYDAALEIYNTCQDTCALKDSKQGSNYIKCDAQSWVKAHVYFQKWLEQVGGEVPSGKEQQTQPGLEDSAALIESVSGKHNKEVKSIKNYYERPQATFPGTGECEECAKKKFKESEPLQIQVGKARFAYEDAMKAGVSGDKLAELKNNYDNKAKDLKKQLQYVLNEDSGNSDASFVLGTLSKWEGNNRQSYEYNRDALASLQARNPFEFKRRMDMINPAMRMELLQGLAPNEKFITLPTIETSPILKGLKENLKTFTNPLKESIRQTAEDIEKTARGLSLSKYLPKKFLPERFQEFSGLNVKEYKYE